VRPVQQPERLAQQQRQQAQRHLPERWLAQQLELELPQAQRRLQQLQELQPAWHLAPAQAELR